jgi:predicted secreted protein
VFEIVLKSNITTGYGWQFAEPLDESLLKMVEHRYVADTNPRGLVGVGGVEVWLFMGLKPGKTNVSLEYVRPWDSTSVAKTASFPVEIKE